MGRPPSDARLERLLVMVPWVSDQDGPTVDEVCMRFGINESELAADLELLFMCGLYPFTPDTLMEAEIADGRVWIRFADTFDRPPNFTAEEAVSLMAAASAVLDLPQNREHGSDDQGTLRSAIDKLAHVLNIDQDDAKTMDIELAPTHDEAIAVIRRAVKEHRRVTLDYYSYGRDAWSRRSIEPLRLFNAEGQWYTQSPEPASGEIRTFRIDRMRNPELTDESFDPVPDLPEARIFTGNSEDSTVVLRLAPGARWIIEKYPVEAVSHEDDGTVEATLLVGERAWLDRLLLRVGKHAEIVSGDADLPGAARRVLRRYAE